MLDPLVDVLTGAWWAYPLLAGLIVFDAVVPVLPSETALIAAGVIAAEGGLELGLLVAVAIAGAVLGDSLAYLVGRGPGGRLRDRLVRSEKGRRRLDEAQTLLRVRPWFVTVARFVPGGRTAATVAAGSLGMPYRRFLPYVAVGGTLWAPLNLGLGFLFGSLFRDSFVLPLGVSLAVAAVLAGGAELLHRRHLATS